MKLTSSNLTPWKISRASARDFSVQRVQRALTFCNKVAKCNFYAIDYNEQKIIVGDSHTPSILGHSKGCIRKGKFDFLKQIISENDQKWFKQMWQEAFRVFYQYNDCDIRMEMEITYDLIVTASDGRKLVLHHRIVPCDLDDDGNLWRSMLHVWTSPFVREERKARIINFATGDHYDFKDGKFKSVATKMLTIEEIQILEFLAHDLSTKHICEHMNLSNVQFNNKKRSALRKLGVNSLTAAVCKAVALGYICFLGT